VKRCLLCTLTKRCLLCLLLVAALLASLPACDRGQDAKPPGEAQGADGQDGAPNAANGADAQDSAPNAANGADAQDGTPGAVSSDGGMQAGAGDAPVAAQGYKVSFKAMDAPMSIAAYGARAQEAAEWAEAFVLALDEDMDLRRPGSEVGQLNAEGRLAGAGGELLRMLRRSLELSKQSGGAFDITIRSVAKLWNIGQADARIPSSQELAAALKTVGYGKVGIDGEDIRLQKGAEIDLGGIAKGYAADEVVERFRSMGIQNALLVLSGNIYALGTNESGQPWQIGISDPDKETEYIGVLFTTDLSVVTSGGYERYSDLEGERYCHILDPKTGHPVKGDLKSVTIISKDSALADAYSTALYVMGLDGALAFQAQHADEFDAVLVTQEGEVICTPGMKTRFDLVDTTGRYRLRGGSRN
jgi:thiamine biosynthesis lipoprotein